MVISSSSLIAVPLVFFQEIYLTLSVPQPGIPSKLLLKVPLTVTEEKQLLATGDLSVLDAWNR